MINTERFAIGMYELVFSYIIYLSLPQKLFRSCVIDFFVSVIKQLQYKDLLRLMF